MSTAEAMTYLGVQANGRLASCPAGPAGVGSSYPEDRRHYLPPFRFEGDGESAKRRLLAVLLSFSRLELVEEDAGYLHFESQSLVFRLISDVEFLVEEKRQLIEFRAALRYGYWDLGANARLVTRIRVLFERLLP